MKWHYEQRGMGLYCNRIVDEAGVEVAMTLKKETAEFIIELAKKHYEAEERRETIKLFVKDVFSR